jgi:hypothetical protein
MKLAGYQGISLGNHDISYFNTTTIQYAPLPILSNNIHLPNIRNSIIYDIDGAVIGVIAYTLTSYFNITEIIRYIIDEALCLRKRATVVIVIGQGKVEIDNYIALKTRGYIDAILGGGGHHNCHNLRLKDDLVVHVGDGKSSQIGTMTFTSKDGIISISSGIINPHHIEDSIMTSSSSSSLYHEWFTSAINLYKKRNETILLHNFQLNDNKSCIINECNTGRIIVHSILDYFNCSGPVYIGAFYDKFKSQITEQNIYDIFINETIKMFRMIIPNKFIGDFIQNFNNDYLSKVSYIHYSTSLPGQYSNCHNNITSWDINYILSHRDKIKYDVYVEESIIFKYENFFQKFPIENIKIFEVPIHKIVISYINRINSS